MIVNASIKFHMCHCKIIHCSYMVLYLEYERDSEDNPADFLLDTIIRNEVTLDMAKQEGI